MRNIPLICKPNYCPFKMNWKKVAPLPHSYEVISSKPLSNFKLFIDINLPKGRIELFMTNVIKSGEPVMQKSDQ